MRFEAAARVLVDTRPTARELEHLEESCGRCGKRPGAVSSVHSEYCGRELKGAPAPAENGGQ